MVLYLRTLVTTAISLYAVRVVLNTLGVQDFGIYNVVAGIVTLLGFLPGAMASATQRFFSYALGRQDKELLTKMFTSNWLVYLGLASIALVTLETAGLWFVESELKIPPLRYGAAITLYHFSVGTFVLSVLTSPFQAIITAHEDLHVYAMISVGESILRLAAVVMLVHIPSDKLVAYGVLVFGISVAVAATYWRICARRYVECRFRRLYWDPPVMREIVAFTGWTLFGQLSTVVRNQAVTVLLNQVFTPIVAAARAIAMSVATQANILSVNFNASLYPPIIKAYSCGDRERMYSLVYNGSKITFALMWILALPAFLEMDAILALWLKTPPPDAALFTRLAIVDALIGAVSLPLGTAARAPGKMMCYEASLGSIQLAIFLASWVGLRVGAQASSVFVVAIVANTVMFFVRLVLVHRLVGISTRAFFSRVIGPATGVIMLSSVPAAILASLLPNGAGFSAITVGATAAWTVICVLWLGIDNVSRTTIWFLLSSRALAVFRR